MIHLQQLTKRYGDKLAVENISFEVDPGEVCTLIGPSGCGKTTTLRMINRLIEPTSGKITINSQDISGIRPEKLRQSMGYAIQNVGLFPHMTVAANIAVVPELVHWDKERINSRIDELLQLVNLDPTQYRSKYPRHLSGGEGQRVGVARALAADPPILLMDEPFGAVDPLTREKLQTEFLRIQRELKKTVVLVTHDLDEAIRLADRIAIMERGHLIQHDTPENILSKPINRFVHDFVGTDRALKRLSRISITRYVRPSPSINITATIDEAVDVCNQCQWVWVVDANQKLLGWIDRKNLPGASSINNVLVSNLWEEIAVTNDATLREALSRMLGQGLKSIPVVTENGTLRGEVSLEDIEAATAELETNDHA